MIIMYVKAKLKPNIDTKQVIGKIRQHYTHVAIEETEDRHLIITYPVTYHEGLKRILETYTESNVYSLI